MDLVMAAAASTTPSTPAAAAVVVASKSSPPPPHRIKVKKEICTDPDNIKVRNGEFLWVGVGEKEEGFNATFPIHSFYLIGGQSVSPPSSRA